MLSLVVYLIPYMLGLVVLGSLLGLYTNYRRVRQAPYFRIRREATQASWRWMIILSLSLAAIGASLYAREYVPAPDIRLVPAATEEQPTEMTTTGLLILPTITADQSLTPKDPRLGPPTITPTQPTPTTSPTPYFSTLESTVTPPADATITITAVSSGISSNRTPVGASTILAVGLPRIYVWFDFENMIDGVSWSIVLLVNEGLAFHESNIWSYDEEGLAFYYLPAQGGWGGGQYEVQLYIGDRLADSYEFAVVD